MARATEAADEAGAVEQGRTVVLIEDELDVEGFCEELKWSTEVSRLLHLSVPLSLMSVLSYLGRMFTMAQVGKLGSLQQSALALANTTFNITGLSLVMGITSGAETFLGQAAGMGEHALLGIVLQRAVLLGQAVAVGPMLSWIWADPLLRMLGQREDLSALAGGFVQLVSPNLLLGGVITAVTQYLAMQGVVRPLTLVSATVAALTPCANHWLIHSAGLGLVGAAASSGALHALQAALLVAVAAWHNGISPEGSKPWAGFSWEAFRQIPAYLAVAIPATGMMIVDWWAFEILTLAAGLLPDARTAVASCGILFGIHVMCYFCVDGVGYAVKIRVAHCLGAGRGSGARHSLNVGLLLGSGWAVLLAGALSLARRQVAQLFSSDDHVIDTVAGCIPWLVVVFSLGSATTVISGALRGCGRQRTGFLINAGAFWGCGLPVATLLALRFSQGVRGLWMGLAAGCAVQLAWLLAVVASQDWKLQVERSRLLVKSQSSAVEHLERHWEWQEAAARQQAPEGSWPETASGHRSAPFAGGRRRPDGNGDQLVAPLLSDD